MLCLSSSPPLYLKAQGKPVISAHEGITHTYNFFFFFSFKTYSYTPAKRQFEDDGMERADLGTPRNSLALSLPYHPLITYVYEAIKKTFRDQTTVRKGEGM